MGSSVLNQISAWNCPYLRDFACLTYVLSCVANRPCDDSIRSPRESCQMFNRFIISKCTLTDQSMQAERNHRYRKRLVAEFLVRGGPGFILRQSMWWNNWHWDISYSPSTSIFPVSITLPVFDVHFSIIWGMDNGPIGCSHNKEVPAHPKNK